jgi:sugar lactone lactonase YvrE
MRRQGSTLLILLLAAASTAQAGFGFGITGAVKNKIAELREAIDKKALSETPAAPQATATPADSATITPTWSVSPTQTDYQSPTSTSTPSATSTASPSPSATGTRSSTLTPSPSLSSSPSVTDSSTPSPTHSFSVTPTFSASKTATETLTATFSPTATPSATLTRSPTSSATPTATASPSISPTFSVTQTAFGTATPTATASPTFSLTASPSPTPLEPISRVVGFGVIGAGGDGVMGNTVNFPVATGMVSDADGNIYFSTGATNRIYKLSTSGMVTIYGGLAGTAASTGDGLSGREAAFNNPQGLAMDAGGALYVAERDGHKIRKIAANGVVSTVAGTGTQGNTFAGPALSADLDRPAFVAVDGGGILYFWCANSSLQKVDLGGTLSTLFTVSPLSAFTLGSDGKIYYGVGNGVESVLPGGSPVTVAGSNGFGYSGDGAAATAAKLSSVFGLVRGADGILYISDSYNYRIRELRPDGNIYTYAGTGSPGPSGDGGPALSATLSAAGPLARDPFGNLYYAEQVNGTIRKIGAHAVPTATITRTFSVSPTKTQTSTVTPTRSVTASTTATPFVTSTITQTRTVTATATPTPLPLIHLTLGYTSPYSMACDPQGNLYFANYAGNRVYKRDINGAVTIIVNSTGAAGTDPDGTPAFNARLNQPTGIALNSAGEIFIAEYGGHRVRKVALDGKIYTVAGTGVAGYRGNGWPATASNLSAPLSVAVDSSGDIYITDRGNVMIRKVSSGVMTDIELIGDPVGVYWGPDNKLYASEPGAVYRYNGSSFDLLAGGNGAGDSGDGGPATSAQLGTVIGMTLAPDGTLYVCDQASHRVRAILPDGSIQAHAGTGLPGLSGDGGPAQLAQFNFPSGVALDYLGNLFIGDEGNNALWKVGDQGTPTPSFTHSPTASPSPTVSPTFSATAVPSIYTVVGNGLVDAGAVNDGVAAASASFSLPYGAVSDPAGNLYFTSLDTHRVYKRDTAGWVTVIANLAGTAGSAGDGGQARDAELNQPAGIARDSAGNLYVAEFAGHRIRKIAVNGVISTVAGDGNPGYNGEGNGTDAQLSSPIALSMSPAGDLYIADYNNGLRKLSGGYLSNLALGSGTSAVLWGADSQLYYYVDSALYRHDGPGSNALVAGTPGSPGGGGDGGPATSATLGDVVGLAMAADHTIYLAVQSQNIVRGISPGGIIRAVAGTGNAAYSGDGASALAAELSLPCGVTLDPFGNLYVCDANNGSIRRIGNYAVPTPTLTPTP